MASDERNALAELAKRLEVEAKFAQENGRNGRPIYDASRIVAELAKVPDCTFKGNPRVDKSADAVIACRAIAEE